MAARPPMVLDFDDTRVLFNALARYLGVKPAFDPTLLSECELWVHAFLRSGLELPEVQGEPGKLLGRIESALVALRRPTPVALEDYQHPDYPLELLDAELVELNRLPGVYWTREGRVQTITKRRAERADYRAKMPRCDWFGHDGESAQCMGRGDRMINRRQVCLEHYDRIKVLDDWKRTYIAR